MDELMDDGPPLYLLEEEQHEGDDDDNGHGNNNDNDSDLVSSKTILLR